MTLSPSSVQNFSSSERDAADVDYQERTPLFKLRKGVAPSSEGIPCARSAAVSEPILRRAVQIKRAVLSAQPLPPHPHRAHSRVLQNARHLELLKCFLRTGNWMGQEGEQNLPELKLLL